MADSQYTENLRGKLTPHTEDDRAHRHTAVLSAPVPGINIPEPSAELEVHQGEREDGDNPYTNHNIGPGVLTQLPDEVSSLHVNDLMYLGYFKRLIRHLTTENVLELMLRNVRAPQEREPLKGFFRDRQNAAMLHTGRMQREAYAAQIDEQLTAAVHEIRYRFCGDNDAETVTKINDLTIDDLAALAPTLSLFNGYIVGGPAEFRVPPRRLWTKTNARTYDHTAWTWLNYYYHENHLNRF